MNMNLPPSAPAGCVASRPANAQMANPRATSEAVNPTTTAPTRRRRCRWAARLTVRSSARSGDGSKGPIARSRRVRRSRHLRLRGAGRSFVSLDGYARERMRPRSRVRGPPPRHRVRATRRARAPRVGSTEASRGHGGARNASRPRMPDRTPGSRCGAMPQRAREMPQAIPMHVERCSIHVAHGCLHHPDPLPMLERAGERLLCQVLGLRLTSGHDHERTNDRPRNAP